MSIVSVPVGVTLSRDFEVNGWSVSPAFDNDVTFAGVQGYEANLSTEVIDSFTYGLGVNYTGSENTDSFGVCANVGCRF